MLKRKSWYYPTLVNHKISLSGHNNIQYLITLWNIFVHTYGHILSNYPLSKLCVLHKQKYFLKFHLVVFIKKSENTYLVDFIKVEKQKPENIIVVETVETTAVLGNTK